MNPETLEETCERMKRAAELGGLTIKQEPGYLTRKDEAKLDVLLSLALAALILAIIMALPSVEGPQTMRVYSEAEVGR